MRKKVKHFRFFVFVEKLSNLLNKCDTGKNFARKEIKKFEQVNFNKQPVPGGRSAACFIRSLCECRLPNVRFYISCS